MSMEKLGLDPKRLVESLRNEEAQLMQKMSELMSLPGEKAANDRSFLEQRLQQVRAKITGIDLQTE